MADALISDVEVNRRIQKKFCRVVSEYGEGTGYIINDDAGLVISSFHLVGAIKPLKIPENFDGNIATILHAAGFIDEELRLKEQALQISSVEELISKLKSIDVKKRILKKVTIRPSEIENYLKTYEVIPWIKQQIEHAQRNEPKRFQFSSENHMQMKISCALSMAGYLDENFCLTVKISSLFQNLNSVTPTTIKYMLLFIAMTDQEIAEANSIHSNKAWMQAIFDFIQQGKHEKEVVLLSDTVEIHIDDEILIGKVDLPKEINETNKGRFLKQLAYLDTVPIKIIGFKNGKTLSEQGKVILTGPTISSLPEYEDLVVGEKVYFGGYPLTQQSYTFSTGMIAAITYTEARTSVVIEAPIAPGNSGSPLFVQKDGQVYWVGVINSEIARVSDKMIATRELLNRVPDDSDGVKIGPFDVAKTLKEISTTLLDNLSTGKGKAFSFNLEALHNANFINLEAIILDQFLDFLVPRQKPKPNTVREQAAAEVEARQEAKIYDVFSYKGKNFYLAADGHGNKHTEFSSRITRQMLKDWPKGKAATFNSEFAKNYSTYVRKIITTIVENQERTNFVRFQNPVGYDNGEETNVVELYYEVTGSHIRPKAESQIPLDKREVLDMSSIIPQEQGACGTPKCKPK